ncbi:MAG: glycosyltransferase [Methanobrevibacter sp.]|nr:glycosyltransferase [Methanobrevibacter sp.]
MTQNYEFNVSAIVLVYNGEKYLKVCIDSLINQTLDNIEIILVNDASTDDSLSICKEFEKKYKNVKIIDKKTNKGLADSGNLGIANSKGEYITLVDNDDYIPPDAYEKLYKKAKSTESDIVVGKANRIYGKFQVEMSNRERSVWDKEQIITDYDDFPCLFYDTFYWNKLFKRSIIIENNIKLPKGKIYADRLFTHKVYAYSKKVAIIPDVVYMWRQRNKGKDTSLSQRKYEINNLNDRLNSLEYDLSFFTENLILEYSKMIMWRVLIPINGIIFDEKFKNLFLKRSKNIFEKINNIYESKWKIEEKLYVYLILNNLKEELIQILQFQEPLKGYLVEGNKDSFYKLNYFKNKNINVPENIFKTNVLERKFISIEKIEVTEKKIFFRNLKIPNSFFIKKASVLLIKKTYIHETLTDNELEFKFKKDKNNSFNVFIPTDQLDSFIKYDVYIKFEDSKKIDKFRLNENNFENIQNDSTNIECLFSKNSNLGIKTMKPQKNINIELFDDKLRLYKTNKKISSKIRMFLKNLNTKEKTYFDKVDGGFELDFQYFLDENSVYGFYIESFKKKFRISLEFLLKYDKKEIEYKKQIVKVYDNNKNPLLKSMKK